MTTAPHLPGWTGSPREAVVDGLRALADELAADERLPLGKYAETQGITVQVNAATPVEVLTAAAVQDTLIDRRCDADHTRLTVTRLRFGAVTLEVFCIQPAALVVASGGHVRVVDVDSGAVGRHRG